MFSQDALREKWEGNDRRMKCFVEVCAIKMAYITVSCDLETAKRSLLLDNVAVSIKT